VSDNGQRAVAYVRESTSEQGQGFSPDAQREVIRRFCAENDLELIGEYCDFHSGWRKSEDRPEFQRLMADAAEHRFDVVLVFHTSRFARSQIEARGYKQLLRERLGIRVLSATQPLGEDHTDPSAFLAESVDEMFDEYYSVSLSFWTKSGLREKARQGHLVGGLPWGYVRDPESKIAVPHPERAPLVREVFERYATGQESDRTLAAWLNTQGARTTRDRQFGNDAVREMLCNAAYAGYVTAGRSKDRSIRGLHEAIITEALFDQVQELRAFRARVKQPGPASEEYLLRRLLRCERCGASMHGTRGSRTPVRRYICSTRRYGDECDQPIAKAQPLEDQLIEWLHDFQPDVDQRKDALDVIAANHARESRIQKATRRKLIEQLARLQDLYVLGDLTRTQYVLRRRLTQEELQQLTPLAAPDLDRARALLEDFVQFWRAEIDSAERRKLISTIFDRIWQDSGQIIAIQPRPAFLQYFQSASRAPKKNSSGPHDGGTTSRTPVRPSIEIRAQPQT
jgi:DNA invertase Pin-like site-specific DNA recombinase